MSSQGSSDTYNYSPVDNSSWGFNTDWNTGSTPSWSWVNDTYDYSPIGGPNNSSGRFYPSLGWSLSSTPRPSPGDRWEEAKEEILTGVGGLLGNFISGKVGEKVGSTPMSFAEGQRLASINDAEQAIYNLIGKVQGKTNYYKGLGEDTIRGINERTIGRTIPEFMEKAERDFSATTGKERDYATNFLWDYEPGFARTETYGDFSNILGSSVNDYLRNVRGIGERGSQRFNNATTATPIRAFRAISEDPSFNLLRNPTFMDQARNPETVKGDVDRYRQMWTYNV